MTRRPIEQLNAGRDHYARHLPEVDGGHFAALWHLFTVGHLVTTDLDAVARTIGCSFADLDFLGTLAIDESRALRATDLASTLYLSNAAVSERIRRLIADGLIARRRQRGDRRAFVLTLTARGKALIEYGVERIAREAKIVRFFRTLSAEDQHHLRGSGPLPARRRAQPVEAASELRLRGPFLPGRADRAP